MPNRNYVSGRAFEYRVCKYLKKKLGFIKVTREYGSKGIMDITAIKKCPFIEDFPNSSSDVYFIQCKHTRKKGKSAYKAMSKEDKVKLVSFSNVCGAKAVFAYNDSRNKVKLEFLN